MARHQANLDKAGEALAWKQHLADNKKKIAAGETGSMVVKVPLPEDRRTTRVRIKVAERVPVSIPRPWGLVVKSAYRHNARRCSATSTKPRLGRCANR